MATVVQLESRLPANIQIRASHERVSAQLVEELPDPVERWALAVCSGLLGGAGGARAELVDRGIDGLDHHWVLRVHQLDWRTLTILVNMLRARFESAYLASRTGLIDRAALLDYGALGFPRVEQRLPFRVDSAAPARASKNRSVMLALGSPPPDAVADEIVASLDLWSELMLCGGYPTAGADPARCIAVPDGTVMYDELSFSQSFSGGFLADESAFTAVIHYASALHARGLRVAGLEIR